MKQDGTQCPVCRLVYKYSHEFEWVDIFSSTGRKVAYCVCGNCADRINSNPESRTTIIISPKEGEQNVEM